ARRARRREGGRDRGGGRHPWRLASSSNHGLWPGHRNSPPTSRASAHQRTAMRTDAYQNRHQGFFALVCAGGCTMRGGGGGSSMSTRMPSGMWVRLVGLMLHRSATLMTSSSSGHRSSSSDSSSSASAGLGESTHLSPRPRSSGVGVPKSVFISPDSPT